MTIVRILGGWRATAFALLALIALCATGIQTARLKYQEGRHHKVLAAYAKAQVEAQIKAKLLADQLANVLARMPKAGRTIPNVVKSNPSGCVLPKPVGGGLREAIRQGNAARSGT